MVRAAGKGVGQALTGMVCALFWGAALASSAEAREPGRLKVVTTVGMITDIVREVAGERAEVTGLIGEGVDPHLYKPTRNDIAALHRADVIFYNGLMLEGKLADSLIRVQRGGKRVYAVTEQLDDETLLSLDQSGGHVDPHVWMDVSAWSKAVAVVARALQEVDPAGKAEYEERAQRYQAELERLHAYARETLASIPPPQRVLITAHDAFNYFGRAYGLRVLGIQGISTESEAGLSDIRRLIDVIAENDVRAVFVESSVADKNVRALVEGALARGKEVRIGGTLYSDAMGRAGTYEGTYLGMIDHNVTTVARALGGRAPAGGRLGKLSSSEKE